MEIRSLIMVRISSPRDVTVNDGRDEVEGRRGKRD